MHVALLILLGIGLGIGAAVPIGPVNVEIARRTLARGRSAGMALGFGAVTVDLVFAAATSLGVQQLIHGERLRHGLGYVGVAVCFVLAGFSLRAAYRAWKHGVPETDERKTNDVKTFAGDYATGFAMTALNLYTWVWWFVTVPALATQHGSRSAGDLPLTCVGVFIAASGWVLLFTTIINRLRQFAGRAWHIGADLIGGVMLMGFGFWALWQSAFAN